MLDFFKLLKEVKNIKPRIAPTTAILMVVSNLIVDLLTIGLDFILIGFVLNPILNYAMIFITGLWLRLNKVDVMKPKGLITSIISFIIEILPVVNLLPALTVNALIHVTTSWAEDLAAQTEGVLGNSVPGGKTLMKGAEATKGNLGDKILKPHVNITTAEEAMQRDTYLKPDNNLGKLERHEGRKFSEERLRQNQLDEERRATQIRKEGWGAAKTGQNELDLRNPDRRQAA